MKLDDIPFIVKDLEKEMPIHSYHYAKVPRSFSQGLPKGMMDWSAHVDNRFLNNHLCEIEEAYHCFKNIKPFSFVNYQLKYYAKRDILNHDGFFNSEYVKDWINTHNTAMISGASQKILFGLQTAHGGAGACNPGSDTEVGGTGAGNSAGGDTVYAMGSFEGTTNDCFDQIAINRVAQGGTDNYDMGCYDDSGGDPNNLYVASGSIACDDTFDFRSITEFTLDSATTWIAHNIDSGGSAQERGSPAGEERKKDTSVTFPGMSDPFVNTQTLTSNVHNMKIGHT